MYAALFASQTKQNGAPFPMKMLSRHIAIKKEVFWDVQLIEYFVKRPSYGVNSTAYPRVRGSIGYWIGADFL